jgi:Holliday junction resolvase RusA-like endonuclease
MSIRAECERDMIDERDPKRREQVETISFVVYGEPVTQGSKRAWVIPGKNGKKPRAIITEDSGRTRPWRQEVSKTAIDAVEREKFTLMPRGKAVSVACHFYFARPKSLKKSVLHKMTKPDVDKLARLILDSLTGIVYEDDSQVVSLSLLKDFAPRPHAQISVVALS